MKKNNEEIEKYRLREYSTKEAGNNGAFLVSFRSFQLRVIASDGMGWDHVAVSLQNRTPNWEEMCFIKDLFFDSEETIVQFHPKASEYVNCHPNCLHLWRKQRGEHELPPSILVGPKKLETIKNDANSMSTVQGRFRVRLRDMWRLWVCFIQRKVQRVRPALLGSTQRRDDNL